MTFKALIIDDEPAAREQLAVLLEGYRDFQVVGMADNADSGLAQDFIPSSGRIVPRY